MKNSELLKIVNKASLLITTNMVIPILDCFLIVNNQLISSDLETYYFAPIDFDGEFLIPARKLKSILPKFPKGAEILLTGDSGRSQIHVDGNKKFEFEVELAEDYPKPLTSEILNGRLGTVDVINIKNAVKNVSNDELRPAMTGVFIGQEIVATTGHVLTWKKITGVVNNEFIMPKKSTSLLEGSRYLIYTSNDGKRIKLQPENAEDYFIFRAIDETFPNYKNVIPQDAKYSFKVSPKQLLNVLDLADLAANQTTHQVVFTFDKNKLFVQSEDIDFGNSFTDSLPVKYSEIPPFKTGFNGKLMQGLLKEKIKNDLVEIILEAANKAIVIDNEALLMPMLLGSES